MVMVMDTKTSRPSARLFGGALSSWLPPPAQVGIAGATGRSARLGEMLSDNPEEYIVRQWQPNGE